MFSNILLDSFSCSSHNIAFVKALTLPPPPTLLLFGVLVAIKAKYKDSCKGTKLDLIPPKFIKSYTQKPKNTTYDTQTSMKNDKSFISFFSLFCKKC